MKAIETSVVLLLIIGGIYALILCVNRRHFMRYLNRIIFCWKKLLTHVPSKNGMVALAGSISETNFQSGFWFRSRVQHTKEYVLVNGRQQLGNVARVHVPPDCIARLGQQDMWTQSRLLDTTRLCVTNDPPDNEVEYLSRGRRWNLDFDDVMIRSADGYEMKCSLAVHWYVPLAIHQEVELNLLFDKCKSGELFKTMRDGLEGILRRKIKERSYLEAFRDIPEILQSLNQHWSNHIACHEYDKLVEVTFTGLTFRLRANAEGKSYAKFQRNELAVERQINEHTRELKGKCTELKDKWENITDDLERALRNLFEFVPKTLADEATSLGEIITRPGRPDYAINEANVAFKTAGEEFDMCCNRVQQILSRLEALIREVDGQNRQFLELVE